MFIQRKRWQMNRRTFLRASGVSLALPWLEAMGIRSTSVTNAGELARSEVKRRVYFSYWGFFNNRDNVPKTIGKNYTLTPALKALEPYKSDFTLLSGLRCFHGGHGSCSVLLTGKNHPRNPFRLPSVDQQLAAFYQGKTRVPSLVLGISRDTGFGGAFYYTPSWTLNRTPIVPENRPEVVFERLFRDEGPKGRDLRKKQLERRASVLDLVRHQAMKLEKQLGKDDRVTIDQYFTAIRDVEKRLEIDKRWLDVRPDKVPPLPTTKGDAAVQALHKEDDGTTMKHYLRLMFDVIVLAFQTDSTRVVAHSPKGEGGPVFKDRTKCPYDYHALTHHGENPEKLRLWSTVDELYAEHWAYFLGKLKSVKEGQGTLLDHTMAAWGTTNGEGGHRGDELPLMLCGGAGLGIKHQGHLVKKNTWIGSVWQTMLDRIGMPLPESFQGGLHDGVIKEVL